MTPDILIRCMPYSGGQAAIFAQPLTNAMAEFSIDTPKRQAAFLAQIAHESGSLKYTREIADGADYEKRTDLGNCQPGDGPKFKGRGLAQVTGRSAYLSCGRALGIDLIENPEKLEEVTLACRSAGWFWGTKNLAASADGDKFFELTRAWNGGYNGGDQRLAHWLRIRKVFGL